MLTCWGHLHLQHLEWWQHPAPPGMLPTPDGFELWEINISPPCISDVDFYRDSMWPFSSLCTSRWNGGWGWYGTNIMAGQCIIVCQRLEGLCRAEKILWHIQYKICFIILTVAFSTIGLKTPSSWGVAETRWTFGKRSLKIDCVPNKVKLKGACYKAFYKIIALFGWKTLYLAITGSK